MALRRDVSEFDSWNRLLRHVYLPDRTWINGLLVREGFARVGTVEPDDRYARAGDCGPAGAGRRLASV